jgi:HEPN superfamily RiboL-PSP-like protein
MDSKAYASFCESLSMAEELVAMEAIYPEPAGADQDGRRSLALRGGAAILAVAAFETFLREVFLERLVPLTQQPRTVDFEKLPERMRIASIWQSLDVAMKGPRGRNARKMDLLPQVAHAARLAGAFIVNPEAFSNTQSNPGPDVVKQMFGDVGIQDIFGRTRPAFDALWGKMESQSFLSDKLAEIVRRRNAVAHTIDVRKVTRDQLHETTSFLLCLATVLDGELDSHVTQLLADCAPDPL